MESTAALSLKVRTAEGDTVEISLTAKSRARFDSSAFDSAKGGAAYTRSSQSGSIHFTAKISGDLNDQEMSDIASLIQSLESWRVWPPIPVRFARRPR
jgi:hypothetical protein